jgi:hypothetical protein
MGSPLHRERASKDSLPGLQAVPGAQRVGSTSWDIKKLKCIAKDGYCGPNTESRTLTMDGGLRFIRCWDVSPWTAYTVLKLSKRVSSAHSQLVEH